MSRPNKKTQRNRRLLGVINEERKLDPAKKKAVQKKSNTLAKFNRLVNLPAGPIYRRVNDLHIVHFIKHIIDQTRPYCICPHYLVGSSVIISLLKGEYNFSRAHSYLKTTIARKKGSLAEGVAAKYLKERASCMASNILPFISATPDFIADDRIIEVKSSTVGAMTKRSIMQVLVSMEIFGVSTAELHCFKTRRTENYHDDPKTTRLIKIIGIKKTATIFTPEFIAQACEGYVRFLYHKLFFLGIKTPECLYKVCVDMLINHAMTAKPGSWKVGPHDKTRFCQRIAWDIDVQCMQVHSSTTELIGYPMGPLEPLECINTLIQRRRIERRYKCAAALRFLRIEYPIYSRYSEKGAAVTESLAKKLLTYLPPPDSRYRKVIQGGESRGMRPYIKLARLFDERQIDRLLKRVCRPYRFGKPILNFQFLPRPNGFSEPLIR